MENSWIIYCLFFHVHFLVNSINEVFTVQQVKMKQVALSRDSSTVPHYGVMFAVLTTFDIDGDVTPLVQTLWFVSSFACMDVIFIDSCTFN